MDNYIHNHHLEPERESKKRLTEYLFSLKEIDFHRSLAVTLTMKTKSGDYGRLDGISSTMNYRFFMNRLQQKTVRIRSKNDPRKIKNFPVLEKGKKKIFHYHVLMEIPDKYINRRDEFKNLIKQSWKETPFGWDQIKTNSLYNENGWKEYISKFRGKDDEVDVGNLHWVS